jgi:hypothetical protein
MTDDDETRTFSAEHAVEVGRSLADQITIDAEALALEAEQLRAAGDARADRKATSAEEAQAYAEQLHNQLDAGAVPTDQTLLDAEQIITTIRQPQPEQVQGDDDTDGM